MISGLEIKEINNVPSANEEATSSSRFGDSLQKDDVDILNKESKSINTLKRNKWAYKILEEWMKVRSIEVDGKFLQNMNNEELCQIMARFIHEARRSDGERYQGATLVSIVAGIQNTLSTNERRINFFNDNNFRYVKESLDAAMKLSAKLGSNLPRKSAGVITVDQEKELWNKCLGHETPEKLLDTLFYLNGIHFALRGGEEHSMLTMDQFKVQTRNHKKCLIYTEKCSKNNSGGLRNIRHEPSEEYRTFTWSNALQCLTVNSFAKQYQNIQKRFLVKMMMNVVSR